MQISVFIVISTNHHVMHVRERLIVSEFMPMSQTKLYFVPMSLDQTEIPFSCCKECEMKSNSKV